MTRKDPQLNLRLPAEVKDMLEKAAEDNGRSVTAETVERLRASFSVEQTLANSMFVMSRSEVRAIRAEIDILRMKARLGFISSCLAEAITLVGQDRIDASPEIAAQILYFKQHLDETGQGYVAWESGTGEVMEAALQKIQEFKEASEKAKIAFENVEKKIQP